MKLIHIESLSVVSNSLRPHNYTVYGLLQARILEWVAFPFFRSSQPRDWTQVSCIANGFFTNWEKFLIFYDKGDPVSSRAVGKSTLCSGAG